MTDGDAEVPALFAGLPRRHLQAAMNVFRIHGRVVIPAGSRGDLDEATPGMEVFLMISGDDAVPAATWRATLVRRVEPVGGGELPDLLPPSWRAERLADSTEDDSRDDDDEDVGPQSFFELEGLEALPKHDWIFANELVGKQERGGRAFFPHAPRLIRPPA